MAINWSVLEKKVQDAVEDFVTLTVTTVTGEIKASFKDGEWVVDTDKTADAVIKASTTIRLDGDITSVVPSGEGGAPDKTWLDFHQTIVQYAIDSRAKLLQSLVGLFKA